MSSTRQLAAIMFTDIVGYTALMGDNSDRALELVRISKEIQKPLVEKHDGKWLKEMGDGALVQFNTALDAVNCAIEIQERARAKLDGKLRIGIHSGDITIEDGDVYGDGVNVASRLESIADPGGIYISDAIWKAIHGQTEIQVKDLGEIPLKNVSYELRTYAVQGVGLPIPADVDRKLPEVTESKKKFPLWAGIAAALIIVILAYFLYPKFFQTHDINTTDGKEKSIAVLPFKNWSGDPANDPYCFGMTDEVITKLSKLKGISKVPSMRTMLSYRNSDKSMPEIAAELGVTHILEASFQKSGNEVKVTLQLIDGPKDDHYWADTYTFEWGVGIFDIQATVAENVARNMGTTISNDEIESIRKIPTDNQEAYELYLKIIFRNWQNWGAATLELKEGMERVINLDPDFIEPYAYLGYYWLSQLSWDGNPEVDYNLCIRNAEKYLTEAQAKEPDNDEVIMYMGFMKLFFEQDLVGAKDLMFKAYELNPTINQEQALANMLLPAMGQSDYSYRLMLEAMTLSSYDPGIWSGKALSEFFLGYYDDARRTLSEGMDKIREGNNLAVAARIYYGMGDYDLAIKVLNEYLETHAGSRPARVLGYLAASYLEIGNTEKTSELLNELLEKAKISPVGSPAFHISFLYAQQRKINMAFDWLEKSIEDHEVELYWLKVEPPFEPLYDDPRWQEMLNKVGFPE